MRPCGQQKPIRRKLVVCGDGACGKTSLLNVFTRGYFPEIHEPTVFETYTHIMVVDGQEVELSLWDTAGQEEFDKLRTLAYIEAHVILVCFSVDNRNSLKNIPELWMPEIYDYCQEAKTLLVALKCDLRNDAHVLRKKNVDIVLYEEGLAMAKKINASRYIECSAKLNNGVMACFDQAARISLSVKLQGVAEHSKPCSIL